MIEAVVFDIGNVVCRFEPERRLAALALHSGLDAEQIRRAIWQSGLDASADGGEIAPAALERALLHALDTRIGADTLRADWSEAFVPDPDVCEIVGSLALPRFAFTNNGPMLTACMEHERAEIAALFERMIYSWQVRALKPDPVAFERLCRELRRSPEALLFVDDSAANTAGARAVGLDAITFTGADQLAAELTARSIR